MVAPTHARLSIVRQCHLVSIARSSFYYEGQGESPVNLRLLRVIDEQFLETPFYGSRQMTRWLRRQGDTVSRKRVRRLMRRLGVHAVCQRPRTSQSHPGHRIYPYLLRDLQITQPNHVWCTDVTYIPLQRGFLYLVAVMDWASRTVLSWRLSNTLEANFCVAGAGTRSHSDSGRGRWHFTPHVSRFFVRFQTISPRYNSRYSTARTDEGAQAFGRPCCARGAGAASALSRFAMATFPDPVAHNSKIRRTTAACRSSIFSLNMRPPAVPANDLPVAIAKDGAPRHLPGSCLPLHGVIRPLACFLALQLIGEGRE